MKTWVRVCNCQDPKNFALHTDDVSVLIQTVVSEEEETAEVVHEKPFDSFPESQFQGERFIEAIDVTPGTLYSMEVRQRFGADGIAAYALYSGSGTDSSGNALFRSSSPVEEYQKTNFILESTSSSTTSAPTLLAKPVLNNSSGSTSVLTANKDLMSQMMGGVLCACFVLVF